MNLDRVTITGADDTTNIDELITIGKEFRFVEWGILSSERNRRGTLRFPSADWIERFLRRTDPDTHLSLHLCGGWVRDLLVGINDLPGDTISQRFERIQLNFHAENTKCHPSGFWNALRRVDIDSELKRQWIFQLDGAGGNRHLEAIYRENRGSDSVDRFVDAVGLFDVSGGAGEVPAEWSPPSPLGVGRGALENYFGYAGGLGPDNIEIELRRIAKVAETNPIWIDMESRVRTGDVLDLGKVRRVLETCAPMVADPR